MKVFSFVSCGVHCEKSVIIPFVSVFDWANLEVRFKPWKPSVSCQLTPRASLRARGLTG